jgi:enoyl-CoA hydratase
MANYEFLNLTIADNIATVRMDRPPVNAMSMGLFNEIAAVFQELGDRPSDVRVAIFTGTGKYFSAGRDIKTAGTEPQEKRFASADAAYTSILHCAVPVIGAINGASVGAGFMLALVCDLIIASESAIFGWPEIDIGLKAGIAITQRVLNPYQSRKLFYTGKRISAQELQQLGIADSVTSPDDLMSEAISLATLLASKPPLALRAAKWAANETEVISDFEQAYRAVESRVSLMLGQSDDHKEATAAFKEKRPPVFKGT